MKRILTGLVVITLISFGMISLSSAFFSDTETSKNNILKAGTIDLKIDNESYYNGQRWKETSWTQTDLVDHLFLNFQDIKPSDWGEDTISIHVNDNPAWACVDISLTSNDDNDCTEPELRDDPTCQENEDKNDGELAQNVEFIFWIDDGDNVLEVDEYENGLLVEDTAEVALNEQTWALADSANGETLDPNTTYYIGKAWCFGDLTAEPLPQDNANDQVSPANSTGGISCVGDNLNNETQTDSLTADFTFRAEQQRNNPEFLCRPDDSEPYFWIIGDEESLQTDNPVDELNFVQFGNFPEPPAIGATYTRQITQAVDDTADEEFPWNSNYNSNYGREINIEFNYPGASPIDAKLSIGWSPGRSDQEQKEVYLDNVLIGQTPARNGVSTAGWWNNMPRYVDEFNLLITPGPHTIKLLHLEGDGTLWDFVKLEEI